MEPNLPLHVPPKLRPAKRQDPSDSRCLPCNQGKWNKGSRSLCGANDICAFYIPSHCHLAHFLMFYDASRTCTYEEHMLRSVFMTKGTKKMLEKLSHCANVLSPTCQTKVSGRGVGITSYHKLCTSMPISWKRPRTSKSGLGRICHVTENCKRCVEYVIML